LIKIKAARLDSFETGPKNKFREWTDE